MNELGKLRVDEGSASAEPQSLSDRVRSLRLPDRTHSQRRGIAWLPWTLCLLLAGALGYAGFMLFNQNKEYQDFLDIKKSGSNPLEAVANAGTPQENVAKPKDPAQGAIALESKGYIIPISLIQVSPKVGGMVLNLNITEGKKVQKGYLLAKLEDVDYQADYDHSKATAESLKRRYEELFKYRDQEIRQAEADYADSKAQRDQLLLDYKRSVILEKSNSLSPKELEVAESSYKSFEYRTERLKLALDLLIKGPRDEKIASAKADWEQAQADLRKAEWRLDSTLVRAPIDGIILSKKAEEGNMVNPSAFSNGLSASLCEMADLTKMEVDLAIAERDISKVFDEQECTVRAEAFPERTYTGWVTRRMPTADRSKGAVPVRVQIKIPREEEGQFLRPEMGAVVTFFNKKIDPVKKK